MHDKQRPVDEMATALKRIEGAYSENTLSAYRSDFEGFIRWCASQELCALPAHPSTVSDYVLFKSKTHATATLRRHIASISRIHKFARHPDPTKDEDVFLAMRRMHRTKGRRQKQALGMTSVIRDKLLRVAGDDVQGLRDQVLLRLAYDSMRRSSELVSIRIEDLEWLTDGTGKALLRFSKTDQEGEGLIIHLTKESMVSIQQWLARTGLKYGPIIRNVTKYQTVGKDLNPESISRVFKRLAKVAGMQHEVVVGLSGHSPRVGAAQDMLTEGKTLIQIMQRGGWRKPETVYRYVEHAGELEKLS